MFYCVFKKVFLGLGNKFFKFDKPRLESQIYPKEVKISSFSYGNDSFQKINLFQTKDENKPLIIDIHGGAWVYGDVNLNNQFCNYMCLKGFNVASIGYRLIDDVLLKDIFDDIFSAIKFILKLPINTKKIYLTGDSAGGHLALVTAKLLKDKELAMRLGFDTADIEISALCINHPVPYTDIAGKIHGHKLITKLIAEPGLKRILYGKKYKDDLLFKELANPTLYINKDGDIPPLLIISSINDTNYYYQSEILNNYLKSINFSHEYYCEKDANGIHVYNIIYPESELGNKTNEIISKFFKKY